MKINLCSESEIYNMQGEGVSTSFHTCLELLRENNDLEVSINSESLGDIMHCHTYGPYYFWRGRKYKGKRVFTAHVIPDSAKGTFPGWQYLMPFFKWYMRKVYSYADVCIAISPMVEIAIRDLNSKTKIVNIGNPIMLETWQRTPEIRAKGREMLGLKDGEFCVLGVGQLETRKGVADFIEIANQIPYAQFRWVGGRPFGVYTDGYMDINHKIENASENIQFPGLFTLAEMPYLYAAADLFIFPSYQENCPLAPLEAAASGMPVIFRNLIEYSTLYKNEYLIAENNEQFIEHIVNMIYNEKDYIDGLAISKKLVSQFDKNIIRKQLVEVYENLTGSKKRKNNYAFERPKMFHFDNILGQIF